VRPSTPRITAFSSPSDPLPRSSSSPTVQGPIATAADGIIPPGHALPVPSARTNYTNSLVRIMTASKNGGLPGRGVLARRPAQSFDIPVAKPASWAKATLPSWRPVPIPEDCFQETAMRIFMMEMTSRFFMLWPTLRDDPLACRPPTAHHRNCIANTLAPVTVRMEPAIITTFIPPPPIRWRMRSAAPITMPLRAIENSMSLKSHAHGGLPLEASRDLAPPLIRYDLCN